MTVRARIAVALAGQMVALGALAHAQDTSTPIRQVSALELFAHVGRFSAGSDEGRIGGDVSIGGTVVVPVSRLAVELDVQTSEVSRTLGSPDSLYRTRRTLVVPAVVYRFGRRTLYGYVGGGVGLELDKSLYRMPAPDGGPVSDGGVEAQPGVFETRQSTTSAAVSVRSGFAVFPLRRLGIRGDVFVADWHLGARIGIGYRFD